MKYLVATHGDFSKGLVNSLELIMGNSKKVYTFQMTKNKSAEDAEIEVKNFLDRNKNEPLIVFTDVFGGSVANLFTQCLLEGYHFELITGLNLPMVLSIILNESTDMNAIIQTGLTEATQGIKHINQLLKDQKGVKEDDSIIIEN